MPVVANKLAFAAASLFFTGVANAEKRVWTAKSGHRVIATLEDQTADAVSLRIANRPQAVVVLINQLIDEDQAFAKRKLTARPALMISKPGAHMRRIENSVYADYVYRRKERRAYALEARREYNANKGPAVYYIGRMPNPMLPFGSGIQLGWVPQPRFLLRPRRQVVVVADDFVPSYSN